ncbi:hypothetical protein [Streptomyces lydicamycinicus]|uniref:hypothetical protein n=1 Tax=Streptomyces lydicamycinicus TaxID=1546107 RepID=UPI003C2E9AE7
MDNKRWVFTTAGDWQQTTNPLTPHRHLVSFEAQLKAAGYTEWTSFPHEEFAVLSLQVYRNSDTELPYMVSLATPTTWEVVYAESLPAMMDLLARWTPTVQGAALSYLAGQLNDNDVIPALVRHLK